MQIKNKKTNLLIIIGIILLIFFLGKQTDTFSVISVNVCKPNLENYHFESEQCYDFKGKNECIYHGCVWEPDE